MPNWLLHKKHTLSRLTRLIQDTCKIALQPTAYDRLYEESLEVQRLAGEGNISELPIWKIRIKDQLKIGKRIVPLEQWEHHIEDFDIDIQSHTE